MPKLGEGSAPDKKKRDKKKKKELLRRLREYLISKTGTGKVGPGGLGSAKQIKELEAEEKKKKKNG